MLQHIRLDLFISRVLLEAGHIHIFQRELHPHLLRVDFSLGKQNNRLKQYSGAMEINMVYPMASGVAGLALIVFHALSLLLMPIESKTGKNLGEEAKE